MLEKAATTGGTGTAAHEWVTRQEAAEILSVSVSAVRKWEREKKLKWCREANGEIALDLESVEKLAAERAGDPMLDRTVRHLEAMYERRMRVVDDLCALTEEQRKESQRKDERIKILEDRQGEVHLREATLLKEIEALQTVRHEREMEEMQVTAGEARKERALNEGIAFVKLLVAKFGKDAGSRLEAFRAFMGTLDDPQQEQFASLLTPPQKKSLDAALDGTASLEAFAVLLTAEQKGQIAGILSPSQMAMLQAMFDGKEKKR